ncbi:MAG: YmdB family metallophosphoesterase [Treponema sp.]|jgi:metallophosphoesterase (TIGR00282 family)|nr:YmdB family metallophosphoesterase [Treponema sp.]
MACVRVLMIGDVMGEPGLKALEQRLPLLIKEHKTDFTVVNGENAAAGFGMTEDVLHRIMAAGADVVSSGNHVWEKRDFWSVMESEERLLRPANYPEGTAGRGSVLVEKAGIVWHVINLQGRELMGNIDCPFKCFDKLYREDSSVTLVDFHAETTGEKEALAYYLDGRAAVVAGTHTHIQTADERLLPRGTAYISDLGMTGVQNEVIGMDFHICLDRARKQILYKMECAENTGEIRGITVEIERETGKALSIRRIGFPFIACA